MAYINHRLRNRRKQRQDKALNIKVGIANGNMVAIKFSHSLKEMALSPQYCRELIREVERAIEVIENPPKE